MLAQTAVNTVANLVILVLIPFGLYFAFHRVKHGRSAGEICRRAGLQLGETRYLGIAAALAALVVAALLIWPLSLEAMLREGSAWTPFEGLGWSGTTLAMALLYGVVKTGFAEELLFRGLIAGSLGRRLSLIWANLLQATIFLLPHLFILAVAPEMWPILPVIFVFSLAKGWIRIRSGSILGPWLIHAAGNVTMGLSVAMRSAAG